MRSEPRASPEVRLVPLLVLALAMTVGFTNMGSFGTVQEAAKAELGLSDYGLSFVLGVGAAVPLALLSIPVGALVDRTNRVRLLILLSLTWTLGTVITAFADSIGTLFFARMLTGIGTTGGLTAALSLGADWCSPARRGRALLIVSVGKTLGIACGFAVTGGLLSLATQLALVRDLSDWREAHIVLACVSLACALPLLLLREPDRNEREASPDAPFRVIAAELWSRRRFLAPLFIGQIGVVMADNAAVIWSPAVLTRNYGLGPAEFAAWMGALILGAGFIGSIVGGLAADWGHKRFPRGGILAGAIVAAIVGVPAALFPLAGSVPLFAAALAVLILCGTITGLITSAALTVLIPNELRGLCIGAFIAVAGVIGFGVAPALVIFVSRLMGGEAAVGSALAGVGVAVSVISVIAFRMAMTRAPIKPI